MNCPNAAEKCYHRFPRLIQVSNYKNLMWDEQHAKLLIACILEEKNILLQKAKASSEILGIELQDAGEPNLENLTPTKRMKL